ncbi:Nicotinamide-nucleotide amidase [hydrothermal vent metagenome]|uniref:Nicotinamide-nucleotide amidase n=1 Tax=hydrothermal vent metagenome TaxID=652676 RepID=A0A3B0ZQR5_9ZZZZ
MNKRTLAEKVGHALKARGVTMAVAESCTGGGVAFAVTAIAGSSAWFDRGFVTYTNQSKQDMLDVSPQTLITQGAVSEATVLEMATGALSHSDAKLALAISGIAGPGGATADKPVGTVCFAWVYGEAESQSEVKLFSGDRDAVRERSIIYALQGVLRLLGKKSSV